MDNQFNFDGSPMPPKPETKKGDGFATASLVLGIVALVLSCPCCCCLYPVAGICAILAIVFSVISLQKSGKNGKAIAGLVLGIVALLIVIIIIIAAMTSSSDMPDISDEQALIDWTYRWLEKTMGKEFADEWYQNMMNAINGNNMDPLDTGALES